MLGVVFSDVNGICFDDDSGSGSFSGHLAELQNASDEMVFRRLQHNPVANCETGLDVYVDLLKLVRQKNGLRCDETESAVSRDFIMSGIADDLYELGLEQRLRGCGHRNSR